METYQVEAKDGTHIVFTSEHIILAHEFIRDGAYNPYRTRPFAIGYEFGVLAVVFANSEGCAIDEAVDAGKLDTLRLDPHTCPPDCDAIHAGNAGEAIDQTNLWIRELPNPRQVFVW